MTVLSMSSNTLHRWFIIHFFKCSMFTTKSSYHTVFLFWVAQAVGSYYSMMLCSVYNSKTSFQSKLKVAMNLNFYNSGLVAHFLFTLCNSHIHILQKLKQVSRQDSLHFDCYGLIFKFAYAHSKMWIKNILPWKYL